MFWLANLITVQSDPLRKLDWPSGAGTVRSVDGIGHLQDNSGRTENGRTRREDGGAEVGQQKKGKHPGAQVEKADEGRWVDRGERQGEGGGER